jgi:hypothetical protein
MALRGRTGIYPGNADAMSSGLQAVKSEHSKIHQGRHFFAGEVVPFGNLDSLMTTREYVIVPPTVASGYRCHFAFRFDVCGPGSVELMENVTFTDGSEILFLNNDRLSANVALTKLYSAATITSAGTTIWTSECGDKVNDTIATSRMELRRDDEELILNGNYNYHMFFRALATDVSDVTLSAMFSIYEHITVE